MLHSSIHIDFRKPKENFSRGLQIHYLHNIFPNSFSKKTIKLIRQKRKKMHSNLLCFPISTGAKIPGVVWRGLFRK